MKSTAVVQGKKVTSTARFARTLLLLLALSPALHDAKAGATITLGADNSSFVDPMDYLDPAVSALVKDGTGTVALFGNSTYTDGTTLNDGGLIFGSNTSIGTGTLTIAGVSTIGSSDNSIVLSNNNAQAWNANFSFDGLQNLDLGTGNVTLNAARTISLHGTNKSLTVGGVISGPTGAGLTVNGEGFDTIVYLANDNAYTGTTTIGAGARLALGNGGNTGSVQGAIVDNGQLTIQHFSDVTMGNAISGSGSVFVLGFAKVTLTGNNSYTGGTQIFYGTLKVENDHAIGTGPLSTDGPGGILDLNGHNVTVTQLNDSIGSGSITNEADGTVATLSITNAATNQNSSYAGTIKDGAGTGTTGLSIDTGSNSVTLSGTNTYSNGTALQSGTLNINSASAIGLGQLIIQGGTIDNTSSGITLITNNEQSWQSNFTFGGTHALNLGTGAVTMTGNTTIHLAGFGGPLTVGGVISGAHSLSTDGVGSLVLTNANSYTGITTVGGSSILQLGDGTTIGSVLGNIVNNSVVSFVGNGTSFGVNNTISGTGAVYVDAGAGSLTLGGGNSYQGGTVVQGGTLALGSETALGASTGQLTVNGALDLNGHNASVGTFSVGTTGVVANTSGDAALTTTNAASGNASIVEGSLIDNGGTLALKKEGTGTLYMYNNSANTFSGGLTLNGGTFDYNNGTAFGAGLVTIGGSGVTITNNATNQTFANNQVWGADFTVNGNSNTAFTGTVDMGSARRTVTVNDVSLVEAGVVSGSGGLAVAGTGVLVLAADNNYTGGTSINSGGTIDLGGGGTTGSVIGGIVDNGLLVLDFGNNDKTFSNQTSGAGNLSSYTAGNLTVTGNNSYIGSTVLNAGTVIAGSDTALGNSADLFMGNATLDLNGHNLTIGDLSASASGAVIGNGAASGTATLTVNASEFDHGTFSGVLLDGPDAKLALAKSGVGSLTLDGANNTYSGGTTLNAGKLVINNNTALGDGSGTFTINGGTLDTTTGTLVTLTNNNAQVWNGNFSFLGSTTGSDLSLGSGDVIMVGSRTVTVTNRNLMVGGVISGAGGLTKAGDGNLILTAANTYSGGTTINGGTLTLFQNGSVVGNIVDKGELALELPDGTSINNVISGTGSVLINGNTNAGLTFTGANTYSGGTTLTGNVVVGLGTNGTLGAATGSLSVLNSSTFDLSGKSITVGALNGENGAQIVNGTMNRSITVTTNSSADGIFNASLLDGAAGSVISFVKSGTGTLTFGGGNGYSGGTTLNAGGLNLNTATALGTDTITNTITINGGTLGNTSDDMGGTDGQGNVVLINSAAQSWNGDFGYSSDHDLTLGTGAVTMSGTRTITVDGRSGALIVNGAVSGATATTGLTANGGGILVLAGDNSYNGTTTVNGTYLVVGGLGTGKVVLTGGAAFELDRDTATTFNNVISGSGTFLKGGSGTVTVGGVNTYTSGTEVDGGTLVVGNDKALGATTGGLAVRHGTLDLNGHNLTVGHLNSYGGTDGVITTGVAGALTLTVNPVGNDSGNYQGIIQDGTGSIALVKSGTGTLILSGANTFTGGTTLKAGTLNLNSMGALGGGDLTIAGVSTIGNTSMGAITLNNHTEYWNANFTFDGGSTLNLGTGDVIMSATRTVTSNGNFIVGGQISGATSKVGLIKDGTGNLTLAGTNTYAGDTTIKSGALLLGNNTTTGSVLGKIVNNADLVLNRSADFTLSNSISGTGEIVMNKNVTVNFTGVNTYSGGTFFNTGTAIMGNAQALGTGDLVFRGGTVDLNGKNPTLGTLSTQVGGDGGTITNGASGTIATLTIAGTHNTDPFSGVIQDGAGQVVLVKSGTSTLGLSGTNTYTGGTRLTGGTLNINSTDALGTGALTIAGVATIDNTSGGGVAIANNQNWNSNFTFKGTNSLALGGNVALSATRTVTVEGTLIVNGAVSGASGAGLTKTGSGLLILNGDNTYSGPTTITSGTLQIGIGGTSGTLGTSTAAIVDNGILAFNRSDAITVNNVISGKGVLAKYGTGNLTLSGANTYSNGTYLQDGTLTLNNAKALGATTANLSVDGGTLQLHGNSLTVGSLVGAGGTITNDVATDVTLTVSGKNSGNLEFAGVIENGSGTTTLVKSGTGDLTLSGASTYGGGTRLLGGTLNVNSDSALGTSTLTIAGAATIDNTSNSSVTINNSQAWNSNFTYGGFSSLELAGDVTMSATRTITTHGDGDLTVGGVISGPAGAGLTVAGDGHLVLTNDNNTYTGTTTISGGTLQLGDGGSTGALGTNTGAVVNNGILAFRQSDTVDFQNVISGKGSVAQRGSGVLVLARSNTYSGGTTLNSGTIEIDDDKALGATSGTFIMTGGTLNMNDHNLTFTGDVYGVGGTIRTVAAQNSITVNNKGGSFIDSTIANGTSGGTIRLEKSGIGTLELGGNSTYSGGTTLNAGTLVIGSSAALGSGPLVIAGVSTLSSTRNIILDPIDQQWNANFTYKSPFGLTLGAGSVTMSAPRTVTVLGSGLQVNGDISGPTGAGLIKAGEGNLVLNGTNTYTGTTTISGGSLELGNGGTTGSLGSGNIVNNGAFTISRFDDTSFANNISGKGGFFKSGLGTLTLTGSNTYSGGTLIGLGTLRIGSANALGAVATSGVLLFGGTLDLNDHSITVGQLSSAGPSGDVTNNGAANVTLTVNGKTASDYRGTISDGPTSVVSLVKSGASALTLGGNSDYSGGTTLNAGTLNINSDHALGTGDLTIAGAATIDNTSNSGVNIANDQNWNTNVTFKGTNDLTISGDVALGTATRTVTTTAGILDMRGEISGSPGVGLTKAGAGTLILGGNNTYIGTTTISAGTLQLGSFLKTGTVSGNIVNNATLALAPEGMGDLNLANTISGKGKVVVNEGTSIMKGNNTYTGGTTVNGGTLEVGSATALGTGKKANLTLNGGTLQTDGTIHQINVTGNLALNSNATIALTLTLDANSEFVNVTGSVSLLDDGPFTFTLTPSGLPPGHHDFLVLTAAKGFGSLTGDDFAFTSSDPDLEGHFELIGKDLMFIDGYGDHDSAGSTGFAPSGFGGGPQPVPEPATWAMLICGGALLLVLQRRRLSL